MTDTPEFLTVRELADLLRVKERKVYDMAASGAVPCSRATGKLLFPRDEIRAWIDGTRTGAATPRQVRPAIMLGSHDPLLDWAIRASGSGLATYVNGSQDGLDRFLRGEGIAAGLHLLEADGVTWNRDTVASACSDRNAALIGFARRAKGLAFRPGGPRPLAMRDLAGLRVAPRQPGSGTARLFDALASAGGLDPDSVIRTDIARTETEAVEAVAQGDADATLGLESVARLYGLDFVPLAEERFDLLVDRAAWFDAPMQGLLSFLRDPAFAARAAGMRGYDVSGLGDVVWNA